VTHGSPGIDPPVALASLSGESDAEWALAAAEYVGAAFLGGIAVDEPTRTAARAMVERDRTEFLPGDPVAFVDGQLARLEPAPIQAGFNVRAVDSDALRRIAAICDARAAVLEINAHCRQDEMCDVGAGQALLRAPDRLCDQVSVADEAGAVVSVKVRTEVPGVDLPALAEKVATAGADAIHVDAMDSEGVVADVVGTVEDTTVIANNGVRDRETVDEYLSYGADAVSVGRPSDDPVVLRRVRDAAETWFSDRRAGREVEQ
jgi:TIM-barrel protein